MAVKKNKLKMKIKKLAPKPRRKVLVGSKIRKAIILPKIKLSERIKRKAKKVLLSNKKKLAKAKVKIHFVKSGKAGVSLKAKQFSRVKKIKKTGILRKAKLNKSAVLLKAKKINKIKAAKRQSLGKKIKIKTKKAKIISEKISAESSAESLFRAKIKVIGVGGGGGSIVSEIGRSLEKATFVIADTDARALRKRSGIKNFLFGENLTHGLGTGVNVELAKKAAEESKEKISDFFKDQDIVIFVASLGGGLGSGATQVFAQTAQKFGGITFGIFTLPFAFEGKNKRRTAQKSLKDLRKSLNVSITIPNEKIFKVIDSNTSITQAFSMVNKNLIESLESLIDIIYNPGLINIDFADLRAILNGKGNLAFLNTVEESGKDRADKICEKVFFNPLYQNNNFTADKILFNISAGSDLSMFEVNKISKNIAEKNPKAKIIFGISKNFKLGKKIKTTILMTGPASGEAMGAQKINNEEGLVEAVEKKAVSEKSAFVSKNEARPAGSKIKKARTKKQKTGQPAGQAKEREPESGGLEEGITGPLAPAFQPAFSRPEEILGRKINITESMAEPAKKTIRRSALDIKEAEALEEQKRLQQEKEWEIPAFLRKVKFKS